MAHPEMGHIYIPHNWDEDPYKGCCPFHGDCLEGLASGKAISDRWGVVGEKLPETHTAWDLETRYLGRAITNISLILSPVKVVLGGGVMKRKNLLRRIQHHTFEYLNGYLGHFKNLQSIEDHIVVTELGERTTIIGALTLAQEAGML